MKLIEQIIQNTPSNTSYGFTKKSAYAHTIYLQENLLYQDFKPILEGVLGFFLQ